ARLRALKFDHATPWRGQEPRDRRLHAAHGSCAGAVHPPEQQALLAERIEVRGQWQATQTSAEHRTEALLQNHHDVSGALADHLRLLAPQERHLLRREATWILIEV